MRKLTTGQAAEALQYSVDTVVRACESGELKCEISPGGHRRILVDDLIAYAQRRGYALNLPKTALSQPDAQ